MSDKGDNKNSDGVPDNIKKPSNADRFKSGVTSIRQGMGKVFAAMERGSKRAFSTNKPKSTEEVAKPKKFVIKRVDKGEVKHFNHMERDPRATWGISGLPDSWKEMLAKSGLSKERILENHLKALTVMKFVAGGGKNNNMPLLTEEQLKKKMNETAQIVESNPEKSYEKIKKIGEGAGGVVYKIRRKEDDGILAVKISPVDELEYIKSEIAYHALSDQHPNIVNYHETFQWGQDVWIVMDFVDGGCLTDILGEENPEEWTEPLISYVMHECLEGLLFMHGQNLLHRDIKSDNVLVDKNGSVKLADFGFAVGLSQEQAKRKSTVGTPFWMAPEVIEGKEYDDRCDIWSLGITAIELVNDEPPHMDKPQLEALLDIVTSPAPKPDRLDIWSEDFLEWLDHCLEKEYPARWHAFQLLKHPFMDKQCSRAQFSDFVQRTLARKPQESDEEGMFTDEEDED